MINQIHIENGMESIITLIIRRCTHAVVASVYDQIYPTLDKLRTVPTA